MYVAKIIALVLLHQCSGVRLAAVPALYIPSEARVIRGQDARPHEVPSMVRVFTQVNNTYFGCGGTLLYEPFVLTAAHCFHNKVVTRVIVYLGCHRADLSDCDQSIVADTYVNHPEFARNVNKASYDISIVKLSTPAKLAPRLVGLVRLLIPPRGRDGFDGERVVMYGWGLSSSQPATSPQVLQKLQGKVAPYNTCRWFERVSESTLCMAREDGTPGVGCFGDSGGPLLYGDWQIGLVSGGPKDCAVGDFTVFARTDQNLQWIWETIEELWD